MSDLPKCFIIMPLTTPEEYLTQYSNDKEHFIHILDELFIPALKLAGFEPIKPITQGSDNIHAVIIKNLETADLVLCDMSILNPNVFFEFGIRTSLNKPVCLVVDNMTLRIPFDTSSINHYKYNGNVSFWNLNQQIERLASHINESKAKMNNGNALWQYFSMTNVAVASEPENIVDAKLDYLISQIQELQKRWSFGNSVTFISENFKRTMRVAIEVICDSLKLTKPAISIASNSVELVFNSEVDKDSLISLKEFLLLNYPNFLFDLIDLKTNMKYRLNYYPET